MYASQHTQRHSEGTHKSTLCVSVFVCILGNSAFLLRPGPFQQIQHSHWSKIRAKPHLGTLPPLKQIRPQRLIKNSKSKARLHRRGGTKEGIHSQLPRSIYNELVQDGVLIFNSDKKCQSLRCLIIPTPFSMLLNVALMLYCS